MKNLFLVLAFWLMGINVHAQSAFISASAVSTEDYIADLQEKGGIMLLSELGDLNISVNNAKAPQITRKGKRADGLYVYEIVIDLKDNKTPKVEVNRRGEIYKTDFVVTLRRNFVRAYKVEYVKRPIRAENQTQGNDVILDEKLTEVEISTTIPHLQVDVSPKLNATKKESVKKTDNSIHITSVVIPWENIKNAKDEVERLREEHTTLSDYIEHNSDKATDADYDKVTMLKSRLEESENAYDAMMHIDIHAEGTNCEQIDLTCLRPRMKLCYGVLLLKQMDTVYVSECSARIAEGARLYSLRQYDAARRAFVNAMNDKNAPPDMLPSINDNIMQCDTCLLYEQYALRALGRLKEMRQAGEANQKDVVKYASGALEFLNVLNKYNPCEFYATRIEKLGRLIEEMPLELKFTIARWVNDASGFREDGKLANVEMWAYYGDSEPRLNMYKDDAAFMDMTNSNSADFKQMGVSGTDGIIEVHLVRKDLGTLQGFFFRPVGYSKRANMKIQYMNTKEMMHRSEGEYDKRQIRLKMFQRVGKK